LCKSTELSENSQIGVEREKRNDVATIDVATPIVTGKT
jgi:hypothetical protein